jgi:long-chain acyl-CoA synthetase
VGFESIPQKVLANGTSLGDRPAYHVRDDDGSWTATSWADYADEVRTAAKALIALGLDKGAAVNVLGFNTPDWVIMDVAAMAIGGVPAGIYTTNSPAECQYILDHSEAPVLLIQDEGQWDKIVQIRDELPSLRHVVMMRGGPEIDDDLVMSWDEFNAHADGVDDAALDARLDAIEPDDLATLIYTSGTTGPPKAVMLSHENLVWTAAQGVGAFGLDEDEVGLSYLPLSHIAEQMFTIHLPATTGSSVAYVPSMDLLAECIKEMRPTYFAGVPRVWEKFYAGVKGQLERAEGAKAKIAEWAVDVGRKANAARMTGADPSPLVALQEKLADKLVLHKVRDALGLDKCSTFITAAAPIAPEIQEFLSAFFILNEIYGQSEDTGPTAMTIPGRTKFGSVGVPYPGTEVRIADDGEILVRGKNVFLGYYKNPEATAETLVDGWLHSGDLGEFDEEGYLHITGRKKDIIITAGGKNVAPKPLETGMKHHLLVGEAVVIGDRRKFLSAVISLDEETAVAWMVERNEEGPAHESESIFKELDSHIDALNQDFARVEQIRKFAILPRMLSIEGGELTPTLKVKRNKVAEHFAEVIDELYAE